MALNRSFQLNTGTHIPAIGFGTWRAPPHQVEVAVEQALRAGFRHLDCAPIYRNEEEVGRGIKASGVKRADIFITTKLWNTKHDPKDVEASLDQSLKDLGTTYVDLYLMHWPIAFASGPRLFPLDDEGNFQIANIDYVDTWKAMTKLLESGKAKAIGVSNMTIPHLQRLLAQSPVVPVANQIEAHPYLQQPELLQYCKDHNILVQAYSPLGNNVQGFPRCVDDQLIINIAKRLGKTPAQVLIGWGVQRRTCVLTKSVTEDRIKENFQDFVLPDSAMDEINAMDLNRRQNGQLHWGIDPFEEVDEQRVKEIARARAAQNKLDFIV